MNDWNLDDWFEFGRKQNEKLEEWRRLGTPDEGKTTEQVQREREERKRLEHQQQMSYNSGLSTIVYILVMLVGTIFYDRVLIWIAATIIYCYYKFVPYNKRK